MVPSVDPTDASNAFLTSVILKFDSTVYSTILPYCTEETYTGLVEPKRFTFGKPVNKSDGELPGVSTSKV